MARLGTRKASLRRCEPLGNNSIACQYHNLLQLGVNKQTVMDI